MNINTFETKIGDSVKLTELYKYLELDYNNYSRFVKRNITENEFAEEGKDYIFVSSEKQGKRGNFRQDYNINIDFAKKLCMVSKSKKGNEIRNMLVELTKKVESGQYLTVDDFNHTFDLVKIFAYYECREAALNMNKENYVNKYMETLNDNIKDKNWVYGKFNNWRNGVLKLGKEDLKRKVAEYCSVVGISEHAIQITTQEKTLMEIRSYEMVTNAIWDLLQSKNISNEYINNICKIGTRIVEDLNPYLGRIEKSSLFNIRDEKLLEMAQEIGVYRKIL